jgi:hypothetical protein
VHRDIAHLVRRRADLADLIMRERVGYWIDESKKEQPMKMIRRVGMMLLVLLCASVAEAQVPVATPLHSWTWNLDGPSLPWVQGYVYEVAVDGQPYAPVLSVSCSGAASPFACGGALPVGLTAGRHTATMRAVYTGGGSRLVGPASDPLTFDFIAAPAKPGGFTVTPTGVSVAGTIQDRYPFVGLDVASALLDIGGTVYIGAANLSVPGVYAVQPGDRLGLILHRP